MNLSFRDIRPPVAVCDDAGFLPVLETVARRWPTGPADAGAGEPLIRVTRDGDAYVRRSPWASDGRRFHHPVNAVCDLVVDLVHAFLADNPDRLCLHCAAVESRAGLVLLAGTYGQGKSTLAAHLAMEGARLYTDDVLPLEPGTGYGMALGILPRLRLPLPETAAAPFRAFAERHAGPASDRSFYLDLPDDRLAPFGATAPVNGIVVLDRRDDARPAMESIGTSEALKAIVLRNFARQGSALDILDRLHAVVARAERLRLTYTGADAAAHLLIDRFGIPRDGADAARGAADRKEAG